MLTHGPMCTHQTIALMAKDPAVSSIDCLQRADMSLPESDDSLLGARDTPDAYLVDHARRFLQLKIGETTTLAGSSEGFNDSVGTSAQFFKPTGVAIDPEREFVLVAVRAWPASPRRALPRASTSQSQSLHTPQLPPLLGCGDHCRSASSQLAPC